MNAQQKQNFINSFSQSTDWRPRFVRQGQSYLPFQLAGIEQIIKRKNILLADDTGLGKTIQAIGAINELAGLNKILIICPASVKYTWRKRLSQWLTKFYSIRVVEGSNDDFIRNVRDHEIVIMNYDIVHHYASVLKKFRWGLKIVDECHYLISMSSKRSVQVLSIWSDRNLFMSATPGERPIELWPSIRHTDKDTWPDFSAYANRYCDAHMEKIYTKKGPKMVMNYFGSANLRELQLKLRCSTMIRRKKFEVLPELKPKKKELLTIWSTGVELGFNIGTMKKVLTHEENIAKLDAWDVDFGESMATKKKEIGVFKLPMIKEFLNKKLQKHDKIVCYVYHTDVVKALTEEFKGRCVVVDGKTKVNARQGLLEQFRDDPKCRIYFGQIKAMGVGTDGLQEAAYKGVFAEIDWSLKCMEQAEDRLLRYGQKKEVEFSYLVVDGSLEAYIAKRLQEKKENFNAMFDMSVEEREGVIRGDF